MPRMMHFEIAAKDIETIQHFYGKTFGWKFRKIRAPIEYWRIKTGDASEPGIDGGLFKKTPLMKANNVIEVPSLDDYVNKVKKNGGSMASPKVRVPGIGRIAVFRDPEGNEFGLLEAEPEEKLS
jgi:predicted enzyme related to lactoylglutathione lyase